MRAGEVNFLAVGCFTDGLGGNGGGFAGDEAGVVLGKRAGGAVDIIGSLIAGL